MKIYVKNGTPANTGSLCENCALGFIARGYGETELVVICKSLYPERQIRFAVRACTGYVERNKPSIWDMEKIALVLDPVALKRDIGFSREERDGKKHEKIELVLDEGSR